MKKVGLLILLFASLFFVACPKETEDTPVPVTLKSISVKTQPAKLAYTEGESFDKTGMVVEAKFSDDTTKEITDYTYTPVEALTLLDTVISISYTFEGVTKNTSVEITVAEKAVLESIEITKAPDKTEYLDGDAFDTTGMEVTAKFKNGTNEVVTEYVCTPKTLTYTDTIVTVSYTFGGVTKTAGQTISCSPALVSISATKAPSKTEYNKGEAFSKKGMEITAVYSDGTSAVVKGYTWTPDASLTLDDTKVTISYTENGITKTCEIEITVKEVAAVEINYEASRANYGDLEITGGDYCQEGNVITLTATEEKTKYEITGYFNGQIVNNTKNTVITLNNAFIENTEGNPAILSSKKLELSSKENSRNYIVSTGASSEKTGAILCNDPAKDSLKGLELGGSGITNIVGGVCHGLKADEVKAKGSGKYYVKGTSKGSAINCKTFLIEAEKTVSVYLLDSKNGIKADENISIASGSLYFVSVSTALKTDTSADDSAEETIEHYIALANCAIYTRNASKLYSTEENGYTEDNVVVEEF